LSSSSRSPWISFSRPRNLRRPAWSVWADSDSSFSSLASSSAFWSPIQIFTWWNLFELLISAIASRLDCHYLVKERLLEIWCAIFVQGLRFVRFDI
jgi:hypothetical protein